jgi:transcriptional regulator with XRE-family HTH domain
MDVIHCFSKYCPKQYVGGCEMVGLEYILQVHNIQHQELAEQLGIKKQNINLWIKGKQNVSKKYLPQLAEQFDLPEEYFQKELTEIERLIVQKKKLQKEVKPVIVGYQQQLSFECENEPDIIEVPIYNTKEMNEIEFEIERVKVLEGFRNILAEVNEDYELNTFQQLVLLFQDHGGEPVLRHTIDALSYYFGVLPDWVGDPDGEDIVVKLIDSFREFDSKD